MSVKKLGKVEQSTNELTTDMDWIIPSIGSYTYDGWLDHPDVAEIGPKPEQDLDNIFGTRNWWTGEIRIKYINEKKEQERQKLLEEHKSKLRAVRDKLRVEVEKLSETKPLLLTEERHFLYQGCVYKVDRTDYSQEEILYQILDLNDKERRKFEYLKRKHSAAGKNVEPDFIRERISEEVRIAVWRRDGGKCAVCGGREKLEYDHIVPVSEGGSNTTRNIEMLCEKCNRSKGAKIK